MNVQDNKGNTPLHIAYKKGREDIVIALMLLGADETIANDKKKTLADMCKRLKIQRKLNRDFLLQKNLKNVKERISIGKKVLDYIRLIYVKLSQRFPYMKIKYGQIAIEWFLIFKRSTGHYISLTDKF